EEARKDLTRLHKSTGAESTRTEGRSTRTTRKTRETARSAGAAEPLPQFLEGLVLLLGQDFRQLGLRIFLELLDLLFLLRGQLELLLEEPRENLTDRGRTYITARCTARRSSWRGDPRTTRRSTGWKARSDRPAEPLPHLFQGLVLLLRQDFLQLG